MNKTKQHINLFNHFVTDYVVKGLQIKHFNHVN